MEAAGPGLERVASLWQEAYVLSPLAPPSPAGSFPLFPLRAVRAQCSRSAFPSVHITWGARQGQADYDCDRGPRALDRGHAY